MYLYDICVTLVIYLHVGIHKSSLILIDLIHINFKIYSLYLEDTCSTMGNGEAIITLLVNYGNFSNVVAENIIKTRCSRINKSLCISCNLF